MVGDGDAQIQRVLRGPLAGAFLAGFIDDDIDDRLAGLRVGVPEHGGGDLDQVGIQLRLVPGGEDLLHLGGGEAQDDFKRS